MELDLSFTNEEITPQFIPHDQFHTGVWLLPVNGSSWYYFKKTENTNVITNEDFMESVDEPLRELVEFLHSKNIRTTPSCAGHNYSKDYFATIYESLKQDAELIKGKGLCLKNIETAEVQFYIDKNYKLPWSKSEFMDFAVDYQKNGVLGLRLNKEPKIRKLLLELRIPGITIKEKDEIVFIYIEPDGKPLEKWKQITEEVKRGFVTSV